MEYENATLIVIRHSEALNDNSEGANSYVIGGFTKMRWREGANSDPDACLYSIVPKFKIFPTLRDTPQHNHLYLNVNSSSQPKGLGFGGSSGNNSRIWISEDSNNGELIGYVNDEDEVFENGYLIEPQIKKIKVKNKLKHILSDI